MFAQSERPVRPRRVLDRPRRLHAAKELVVPVYYSAAISCGEAVRSLSCLLSGSPANRRNASDICTRPLTPVMTTSTIVKDEWKWPRALSCSTGTPAVARASA